MIHSTKKRGKSVKGICVKLTKEELQRLEHDSEVLGKTIPQLLRDGYFNFKPVKVLLREDDKKLLLRKLGAIGNNVNQVAKAINSSHYEGWSNAFEKTREQLDLLVEFIGFGYGLHKN